MTVMPQHTLNPSNPKATEVTSICEIFSKNFSFRVEVKASVIFTLLANGNRVTMSKLTATRKFPPKQASLEVEN